MDLQLDQITKSLWRQGERTSRDSAQPWDWSKVSVVMHQFVRLMAKWRVFVEYIQCSRRYAVVQSIRVDSCDAVSERVAW